MSKVHAIIVHHRGRELLEPCLDSLLASRDVDLEIVVVGNDCREELPTVVEQSPRVHLVRSMTSLGFSTANNLGSSHARTKLGRPDYYFFVNNDTEIAPDCLALLVAAAEEDHDRAILGPRLMIDWARDHLNSLGLNVTTIAEAWDEGIGQLVTDADTEPGVRSVVAVTGAALLMRESVHSELGGWPEAYDFYYEDLDLGLRARSRGYEVVVVRHAEMWHKISATANLGSDFKTLLMWRNRFLLILANWPAPMLLRLFPRIVITELELFRRRLAVRAFKDARLQFTAWIDAIAKLGDVALLRGMGGGDYSWTDYLRPAGSVPVIQLPEPPQPGESEVTT